jgi:hypothetical protein
VGSTSSSVFSLFSFIAGVDRPEVAKNNEELPYVGTIFLGIGIAPFLVRLAGLRGVVSLKQHRGILQDTVLMNS